MNDKSKLAALTHIAAIRREAALHDLAMTRKAEARARSRIEALAQQRMAAIASSDPSDLAAGARLDRYCLWTEAQRQEAEIMLRAAEKDSALKRELARQAAGRSEVLEKLGQGLDARMTSERARRA